MARKRNGDHPLADEVRDEADKSRDLLDDPVEDVQAAHADAYLADLQRTDGGAPFAERAPEDVQTRTTAFLPDEVHPQAGRNVEQEPALLLRDADLSEEAQAVALDRRWHMDADAPKAGADGGAKLGEPDDAKKNPAAPWPGPGQSFAASPTASPEPGPEPTVQFEPPQAGIEWEHKPEAVVGVIGPGAADQELRRLQVKSEQDIFHEQRSGGKGPQTTAELIREQRLEARKHGEEIRTAQERDRGPRGDDEHPRDEAGQISLEYLTDKALEAVGAVFRGAVDVPEPYRVRIALEHAARKIMSPQWWAIHDKHFSKPVDDETRAA